MIKEVILILSAILLCVLMISCFERIRQLQISRSLKYGLYILSIILPPVGYLVVRGLSAGRAKELKKAEDD